MAQTTLIADKQLTRKRRPLLRVVDDVATISPKVNVRNDIMRDHKFFLNSLLCEMIEKI